MGTINSNDSWEKKIAEIEAELKRNTARKTTGTSGCKQLKEEQPFQQRSPQTVIRQASVARPSRPIPRPSRHGDRWGGMAGRVNRFVHGRPRYWWVDAIGCLLLTLLILPFFTDFEATTISVTYAVLLVASHLMSIFIFILIGLVIWRLLFRRRRFF